MIDVSTIGKLGRPVIVAHRGASHIAHENTIKAFEIAIDEGADLLELDVRMTKDRLLIVHHDASIVNSNKLLSSLSLEESILQARTAGYDLCSLEEVLTQFSQRIALDIEIKGAGLEHDVVDLVKRNADQLSSVLLKSFDSKVVNNLSLIAPDIRRGLIVDEESRLLSKGSEVSYTQSLCIECGAQFLAAHWSLIDRNYVLKMHDKGIPVLAWTVDNVAIARRLMTERVDGIITNFPGLMVKQLRRQQDY